MKKLVHGVGYNNTVGESKTMAYVTWTDMLKRCYSPKHANKNAYQGTEVCKEWQIFSNFRDWYNIHHQQDWKLDKDIIDGEGILYSPETCMFIPQNMNCILVNVENCKGYTYTKTAGIYEVSFSDYENRRRVHIGRVIGEEDANLVYRVNKFVFAVNKVQDLKDAGELTQESYNHIIRRLVVVLLQGHVDKFPASVADFNHKYLIPSGRRMS